MEGENMLGIWWNFLFKKLIFVYMEKKPKTLEYRNAIKFIFFTTESFSIRKKSDYCWKKWF